MVSVVYPASQGCETCSQYESDANQDGDTAAAEYFAQARSQYEELVSKGKELRVCFDPATVDGLEVEGEDRHTAARL